jgi:hypothetical protein
MTDTKAKATPKRSNGNGAKANGAKRAPAGAKKTTVVVPAEETIRERAFYLYESRGMQHGLHDQDWRRAEQEILAQ